MEHVITTDNISVDLYENSRILSTTWNTCNTAEEYVSGIKAFYDVWYKVGAKHALWHSQTCQFALTPELQAWTDVFLNVDALNKGFDGKVALIVGDNMLHQLSLANMYEEGQAKINSRFFAHLEEALPWLEKKTPTKSVAAPAIRVKSLTPGNVEIKLEIDSEDLNEYIFLLNRMLKSSLFKRAHAENFQSLSVREKDVFHLIVRGFTNPMISRQLFISIDTVKTHRRNIMQKLHCRNVQELLQFAIFVQI
ncbi:MAG: helix-turn-helix transcriptional regulator [Chitinophaga sp.]|uniref:helix-turn-helix domain-containing protein n=1 Tax=Chitinophaga sp. TaxID=1869181 RepID=UPI0025BAEC5B|nr:helix-turn-helix transcriptional regulator [Chitinophaga sp.]MBV8251499.1 helix-turn-helix transcriptional regulator [Chitinophaga sp.]